MLLAPLRRRRSARALIVAWALTAGAGAAAAQPAAPATPAEAADALLAADRAFSAAGAGGDLAASLSAMFADSVVMLAGPALVQGADSAAAALRANPANAGARLTWTPIRAGVAADGRHGFTLGFTTLVRADGSVHPGKYVAYWTRGDGGWRVAAYKRVPRAAGAVDTTLRAPSLPARLVPAPAADAAAVAGYAEELRRVEREFSDAGRHGLGAAFRRFGAPDAYNVGGPAEADFVVGPEAIGRAVSGGSDAPVDVRWSADHTIVASSGDLGVNLGVIHFGAGPPIPFLTVWRRDGPGRAWRYVAE